MARYPSPVIVTTTVASAAAAQAAAALAPPAKARRGIEFAVMTVVMETSPADSAAIKTAVPAAARYA